MNNRLRDPGEASVPRCLGDNSLASSQGLHEVRQRHQTPQEIWGSPSFFFFCT
jgi:hypothetical protein